MTDITTLSSGMRVVTDHNQSVESASLGVWVNVGSRHESQEVNGVSHFLEHMAFKGTTTRGVGQIAEEIENVGGDPNAYTTYEATCYTARILKDDVPLAIDILSDILQHSTFEEDEVERERSVILQEIAQYADLPQDVVSDLYQETAYPDQPLGRPILGPQKVIEAMSRAEIANYMKSNYFASGMVLAAVGNVDHAEIVAQAEQAFSEVNSGILPPPVAARYVGGQRFLERDLEQVHICAGFEGVPYGDPDYHAMKLLSQILGGGMSSRLFREIREKRGLVYHISAFSTSYVDGGDFAIYAATDEEKANELMTVLCDEINKVSVSITSDELKRAKAQYKAGLVMDLESAPERLESLARNILIFGRDFPYREIVERIDAVHEDDIITAAQRVLKSTPTLAAVGAVGCLERMEPISARFAAGRAIA